MADELPDDTPETPPPAGNGSVAAKLHANLTWMRANGASVEEQHAEIAKAQAAIDRQNTKEQADATQPGVIQKGVEAVVSGFPGAQRAVAGYRGLLSLAGVGNETPDEALSEQRKNVASLPAFARIPLQLAGGTPAAVALAPLGLVGGSAAFGAAAGADAPAESLGERAKNTVESGVLGAAVGKGGQLLGKGIANVANRIQVPDQETTRIVGREVKQPLTDWIAGKINKVNPNLAAAMGTRGQVNQVFGDRQDILAQLGDNGTTAGRQQLDRIAATKAKANQLYAAAREDTQMIQDPRVQALMQDPEVAKTFQTVQALRKAKGNPVPEVNNLSAPPQAQMNKLIRPEDWARMMQNPENAANLQQLPTGLSGLTTEAMPDPEALHTMKRYLEDASKGLASPSDLTKDKAIATLAKVGQLRDVLHEVSPAWKEADVFYADAKGQEDAFAHGFDAFRHANNPSGEQLPTHTAEAMVQEISTPRYPGEPPAAMNRRAIAFRSGVREAAASAVRGAPVDRAMKSALSTAPMAGDEETQAVRQIGFDNPDAGAAFEKLLATQRGNAMQSPAPRSMPTSEYAYHRGPIRAAIQSLTQAPDLLATPQGQQMIAQRGGTITGKKLRTGEIDKMWKGSAAQDAMQKLIATALAGQAARSNP